MKKLLCIALVLTMLPVIAFAGEVPVILDMAFGLFSVELPRGSIVEQNTSPLLSMYEYNIVGTDTKITVNYAPIDVYEYTAGSLFDSNISLAYALSGPDYSESDITDETLENGVQVRWQMMRGGNMHSLWFEVFSENYGYNMLISGPPTADQDELMLSIMRSFSYDAEHETDILEQRQTDLGGGRFMSIEHGLVITLDETWGITPYDRGITPPNCAFVLDYENGRRLIQLMCEPASDYYTADFVAEWYMDFRRESFGGVDVKYSEPYTVNLEKLGVEAVVVEEYNSVNVLNVAFIYEGYAYYGSFMWIVPDEEMARPFMENAISSLSAPE